MQRRVFLFLAVLVSVPAIAQAAATIDPGNWIFNPGTAGNPVSILISAVTAPYTDSNMRLNINGNVGPAPAVETVFGESVSGVIPAANMAGSVWDHFLIGNATGGIAGFPNGTTTGSNGLQTIGGFQITVPGVPTSGVGIYAKLTISTVGVAPGVYPLLLSGGGFGDTDLFNGLTAQSVVLLPGSITVVPEPSSILLGFLAVAGLAAVAIRRRRRAA